MHIEFWDVGSTAGTALPMSTLDISAHLLSDWLPTLPSSVSSSLIGWPPYITEEMTYRGSRHLTLRKEAGGSERQWKGMLSWMLGVAGTRHFLSQDGYQWIAPMSAFYPNVTQAVNLPAWHPAFPLGTLIAHAPVPPISRLRPDFLALRPIGSGNSVEWAVAESKGTSACLTSCATCPQGWSDQARNILVTINGAPVTIPRHIVVATRVNPNASRSSTRRIQVRAWNSSTPPIQPTLPIEMAVEIAAAQLFGLFRSLNLPKNAQCLASASRARAQIVAANTAPRLLSDFESLQDLARDELDGLTRHPGRKVDSEAIAIVPIESELGTITVEIDNATLELASHLSTTISSKEAAEALADASKSLDKWNAIQPDDGSAKLPCGIRVRFPDGFLEPMRRSER